MEFERIVQKSNC